VVARVRVVSDGAADSDVRTDDKAPPASAASPDGPACCCAWHWRQGEALDTAITEIDAEANSDLHLSVRRSASCRPFPASVT
jgi:hypothetical protein